MNGLGDYLGRQLVELDVERHELAGASGLAASTVGALLGGSDQCWSLPILADVVHGLVGLGAVDPAVAHVVLAGLLEAADDRVVPGDERAYRRSGARRARAGVATARFVRDCRRGVGVEAAGVADPRVFPASVFAAAALLDPPGAGRDPSVIGDRPR